MASVVLMPKVGISVETCIITEWLKSPGDAVEVGDILFSYETDKSVMECESTEAGTLLERFFENGDEVPVLVPVCAVGKTGEDVSALRPGGETAAPANGAPAQEPAPAAAAAPAQAEPAPAQNAAPAAAGPLKISPRAKRLAGEKHVNAGLAAPTGPGGRVIERDVRALLQSGEGLATAAGMAAAGGEGVSGRGTGIGGRVTAADATHSAPTAQSTPAESGPEFEDKAFSGIRKVISSSMTASLRDIPQLTHNFSFDASAILAYRKQLKAGAEALGLPNISLNDFILFAVSRALPKYPQLNAHMLDGEHIRLFRPVHLGMAVDTERGLMVPVIKNAHQKSLAEIAAAAKTLAKQAQEGSLPPDNMSGGTFTVSNLGALGVESFTPVINPPQTGILGVDNIIERVRTVDGALTSYPAMGLSLTYDHRAIDGAPASRFVGEVCRMLEHFTLLLAQ